MKEGLVYIVLILSSESEPSMRHVRTSMHCMRLPARELVLLILRDIR